MSLLAANGTFEVPNSGTSPTSITGVGFQGKVLILFAGRALADSTFTAESALGIGFAVSSTERYSMSGAGIDAHTAQASTRDFLQTALNIYDAGLFASADFVSWDADGFTLSWPTNIGNNYIVNYLVLGGSDITNATVRLIAHPAGTGVDVQKGFGFKPDCLLTFAPRNGSPPVTGNSVNFSVGMTDGVNQATTAIRQINTSNPTSVGSYQRTNKMLSELGGTPPAVTFEESIVSLDQDGFTRNVTVTESDSSVVLAIKGIKVWVGSDTQKTSTGTQSKTGVGFPPKALFVMSANDTSSTSVDVNQCRMTIGGAAGINHSCTWQGETDNVATSVSKNYASASKVLVMASEPSTINAAADVTLDPDGYTMNWTTADAVAREFVVMAFGDGPTLPSDTPFPPLGRGATW